MTKLKDYSVLALGALGFVGLPVYVAATNGTLKYLLTGVGLLVTIPVGAVVLGGVAAVGTWIYRDIRSFFSRG